MLSLETLLFHVQHVQPAGHNKTAQYVLMYHLAQLSQPADENLKDFGGGPYITTYLTSGKFTPMLKADVAITTRLVPLPFSESKILFLYFSCIIEWNIPNKQSSLFFELFG